MYVARSTEPPLHLRSFEDSASEIALFAVQLGQLVCLRATPVSARGPPLRPRQFACEFPAPLPVFSRLSNRLHRQSFASQQTCIPYREWSERNAVHLALLQASAAGGRYVHPPYEWLGNGRIPTLPPTTGRARSLRPGGTG